MTDRCNDKHWVRASFDRAAKHYESSAALQKEVGLRMLERLDYIRLTPRMILDAGVGTGEAVTPLMKRYKKSRLIVLDLSEQMLARALAHGGLLRRPEPVCADIEQLPFRDNSFDLVYSNLTLQWCNDLDRAFAEFRRVIRDRLPHALNVECIL